MLKTTRTGEKLRMVTDRAVAVELLPKVVAMLDIFHFPSESLPLYAI